MTIEKWPETYETVLRRHLPHIGEHEPLERSTPLDAAGLDSIATVQLIFDLEDAFGTEFPPDAMTESTFATAGSLWDVFALAMSEK